RSPREHHKLPVRSRQPAHPPDRSAGPGDGVRLRSAEPGQDDHRRLGGLTSFTYDPNGNLQSVTDARSNSTTHTYDAMDRLATRVDPLGGSEAFVYDLAGNLTRRTDRKGQLSTFVYDSLNRLTTSSYADGSGTSFVYAAPARLVRVDDSPGGPLPTPSAALARPPPH